MSIPPEFREIWDGFFSPWAQIHRAIVAGKRPRKRVLVSALRRGEPVILSGETQNYIADLLSGKAKAGRRAYNDDWAVFNAEYLIRRVDRWERVYGARYHLADAKMQAYGAVGREARPPVKAESIRRRYQAAKKLKRSEAVCAADWKLKRLVGRK